MQIVQVEILGFMGRELPVSFELARDLNITTGRNGSGKTTLLKLIWYLISGNVHQALREVNFQKAVITTTEYKLTVYKVSDDTCKGELERNGKLSNFEDGFDEENIVDDARDMINNAISPIGKTIFFPTFRRIEGGFSIESRNKSSPNALFNSPRSRGDLGPVDITW